MAYQKDNTDWISKEKRELFAKAVNSMMMTDGNLAIEKILRTAKQIVDTAFKNYPDNTDGKGEQIENIIN